MKVVVSMVFLFQSSFLPHVVVHFIQEGPPVILSQTFRPDKIALQGASDRQKDTKLLLRGVGSKMNS